MTRITRSHTPWLLAALCSLMLAVPVRGAGDAALERRIENLLASMTLEEKLGQMTLFSSDWARTGPSMNPSYLEGIRNGTVGAVFNAYTADFTRKLQKMAVEQSRLGIPVYLPPFKAALDAGAATFMTAFNELNGVPRTGNSYLLSDVLRRQWGFGGFVVTDYTSINEMVPHGYAADLRQAGKLALLAGVDMDMQGAVFSGQGPALVRAGEVPRTSIDDSVRRILRLKGRLGLLDDPYRYCDPAREKALAMCPDHLAAARELAGKSMVLLRNERRVLPLAGSGGTIAVVGPLADDRKNLLGSWSGDEVAQLYLRDMVGSVTRPLLELKRFERFRLAPGQRRTVRFTLGPQDLAFVHPDLTVRPEPGEFKVLVGPSSGELKGATFSLVDGR